MKKIIFLLLFIILLLFPQVSFAHVLETDNSVGAVIHIDPEDDPIVGQPSNIYFEFKDKENKFRTDNCDCKVEIQKNGNLVFTSELFGDSNNPTVLSSAISYIFPETGKFQINVIGKPKNEENFTPFSLRYDIDVTRSNPEPSIVNDVVLDKSENKPGMQYYVGIGFGVLVVSILLILLKRKR